MLGMGTKTDTLDARGLNRLQRTGTLPPGWIPPGALRDQRDLPRPRRMLTRERTRLKHRIHATLAQDRVPARGRQCPGRSPRPRVVSGGAPRPPTAPPGPRRSASVTTWTSGPGRSSAARNGCARWLRRHRNARSSGPGRGSGGCWPWASGARAGTAPASRAPRTGPPMPAPRPACTPAGAAPAPARSGGTSPATARGPSSKRRVPAPSIARSGHTGTSGAALRASSSGRATRRRSGPLRAPGPRPALGS
jgi:hypothetical protein